MPDRYARRRLVLVLVLAAAGAALAFALRGEPPDPPTATPAAASSSSADRTTTTLDGNAIVPTDRFVVASGDGPVVGAPGPLRRYAVAVEEGIPIDPAAFAQLVESVLGDPRGWTAAGDVGLQRVGTEATADFRIHLATPATTDAHCAPLVTEGETSCRNGPEVMLNLVRWLEGAAASGLPLDAYRQYMISHEVGHALGHGHVGCPGPGQPAPIMLQQTLGLQGCAPNPWPYP